MPKTGGAPTNVHLMQSAQVSGLGQSITTDGRHVFVGTSASASSTHNVYALDPEVPSPPLQPFALTPLVAFSNSLGQMSLAGDGKIFASDSGI